MSWRWNTFSNPAYGSGWAFRTGASTERGPGSSRAHGEVTSADIVAAQAYIKQLPNAENSGFVRQYVSRMEAPDENTVIYHLNSPLAYLFSSTYLANPTSQPMIPKEMLDVLDTTPAVGSRTTQTRQLRTWATTSGAVLKAAASAEPLAA